MPSANGITWGVHDAAAPGLDTGSVRDGIRRAIRVERSANWTRWLDTFTNTTARPLTVEVTFGGQLGTGAGTGLSRVVDSSSGDALITNADSWAEVATSATSAGPTPNGPSAVVIGSASP